MADVLQTWDVNQVNMSAPSNELVENGWLDEDIPTSAVMNFLLHFITANRVPVGTPQFFICDLGDLDPNYLPLQGATLGDSASEAAYNDDKYKELFLYIWNNWAQTTVLPDRGASALADWEADKFLTLPDLRGCTIAGYTPASGSVFNVEGAVVGSEEVTLTIPQLPAHTHSLQPNTMYETVGSPAGNASNFYYQFQAETGPAGGDQPHPNVQPSFVGRWAIKW